MCIGVCFEYCIGQLLGLQQVVVQLDVWLYVVLYFCDDDCVEFGVECCGGCQQCDGFWMVWVGQ